MAEDHRISATYQVAGAVLVLDVGGLGTLACDNALIAIGLIQLWRMLTGTRGAHQDDAHLLGDRLGLVAIDEAALQVDNPGLELVDGVLQTGDNIFCDGSHCD